MPLDGYTLHLLTEELKKEITGNRIEKIHMPSKDEFVFHLRSREGAKRLVISASSSIPKIHLTGLSPENPDTPPMLCMFLRKHLTGCIIKDISQLGLDRVVFISLTGTDEIGDPVSFTIAAEIMAKHSNFIVSNSEGIIIEAVKKSDLTTATIRQIQPGFKYVLPPAQDKLNILEKDTQSIIDIIKKSGDIPLSTALLRVLQGASPLIAREIACLVTGSDMTTGEMTDKHFEKLAKTLDSFREKLEKGGTPTMLMKDGKPFDLSFTDITQYGFLVSSKVYGSYSELIDYFYSEKTQIERTGQQSRELQKTLGNLIARSRRKLETRKEELAECAEKETMRIYAELILSNQYTLSKGALFYDIENYYDNYKTVRIKADPALSPAGNAQKYYKEYNKLKNAEKLLDGLISESKIEIEYLESVLDSVKRARGFSDIALIKSELSEEGYLKKNKNAKAKKQKPLPPVKYVSDDGYTILVGRNNVQNEELSFKTAARDDSWFHVQSFPGSHVIVLGNGDILPERTCRQAAAIAAYNSSARDSSQVAVDYTEIRELKKLKGGKKGMVIYHTYNTMWVTPDKELCERLLAK